MGKQSRTTQFFGTPLEVADLLVAASSDLDLVVYARPSDSIEEARPADVASGLDGCRRLIGKRSSAVATEFDWGHPARFGFVLLDLPVAVDGTLFMASLQSTNSWVIDGVRHTSPESPTLHRQLETEIRREAIHPARVSNDRTGASGLYDQIRVTEGALRFVAAGGTLRQEGVGNLRFFPAV